MKDIKIVKVDECDGLVKVVATADGWSPCTFIFCGRFITCFGDIRPFTWHCTWNTAERIKQGDCSAHDFHYLYSKLEHRDELEKFDHELMEKELEKLKAEILEDIDDDEGKEDFLNKWKDNEYLLCDVDEYRLNGLDEFFSELDINDAYEYYGRFYDLPYHYRCAVAFLEAIENHFKEGLE